MELLWKMADLLSLKLYLFISIFSLTDKLTFAYLAFTCEYPLNTRQQDIYESSETHAKKIYRFVFQPLLLRARRNEKELKMKLVTSFNYFSIY